jgi:tetrahydromethanopterin S-methyltransferase subunit G
MCRACQKRRVLEVDKTSGNQKETVATKAKWPYQENVAKNRKGIESLMNRHQKHPRLVVRNPAYRQAFQRLDESLEQNSGFSNAEKIRLMRQALFADVDALEKSGTVKIPR